MAFTSITSAQVLASEPVTTDLFDLIRTNLDDHETRITANETSVANNIPIEFFWGNYSRINSPPLVVEYWRVPINLTIDAARIHQDFDGTSGTTEVDILFSSTFGGSYTSIFSTLPSIAAGSGDGTVSSNQVLTTTSLTAGHWLQIKLTSKQSGIQGSNLTTFIEWS